MLEKGQIHSGRDIAITLLHVIGTGMILLCHIFQVVGIYALGELLITAVPLFLFVAGFLSGRQPITNTGKWLLRKMQRIWIPTALFLVIIYLILTLFAIEKVTAFQWIFSLLNLQGLNYTYWKFDDYGAIAGCGHLWFVTTMMFCYFLTPLAQRIPALKLKRRAELLMILLVLIVQAGLLYLGFQLSYIITYFFGYFTAKKWVRTDGKWYAWVSLLTVAMAALRLLLREYLDASILYDRYIALISGAMVGVWIFYTVFFLKEQLPKLFTYLDCPLMWYFERLSFYFYLTHYIFLRGCFAVWNLMENPVVSFVLLVTCSAGSAVLLQFLTEKVVFRLIRRSEK